MAEPIWSARTPTRGHERTRILRVKPIRWMPGALLLVLALLGAAACGEVSPTGPVGDAPQVEAPAEGSDERSSSDDGSGGSPSGAASYPNRPSGFATLTETSYAAASEGGFSSSTNANFAIVDDASAPRSASKVARATFPAGLSDGRSPIWSDAPISSHSVRRLYLSFWVKVSDNWQAHSSGVNKVAIAWIHDNPAVVANIQGAGSGRLSSEIRIQGVPGGARNLSPNKDDPDVVRDRWHRWEIVLVSNTGDAADGEIHWWLDGQKVGAYSDVRFGTSSQPDIWQYATWRPVWGGRGDTVRRTMHMWMDHYYVAGAR